MKIFRILTFLILLVFSNISQAQIEFLEILPIPTPEIINGFGFINVTNYASSDVDNDNDFDVIIFGYRPELSLYDTELYLNDGAGNFTLDASNSFDGFGIQVESVFGDFNGDNFEDLVVSGENNSNNWVLNLYLNDGNGNFNIDTNNTFEPLTSWRGMGSSDIDNDNDLDLMVGSDLYINDGIGNFSLATNTPFSSTVFEIKFADVDNDNDQDVLTLGIGSGFGTKLFINDGLGNFTYDNNQPFRETFLGFVDFADIDNDNDQDVLITGSVNQDEFTELYRNDGNGNFSLDTSFDISLSLDFSQYKFVDVESNGNLDLIISGRDLATNEPIFRLYKNDGNGNFLEDQPSVFEDIGYAQFIDIDIDNDNDQDLIINPSIAINAYGVHPHILVNNGFGDFDFVIDSPIESVNFGDIAFSDINNDSDLDLIISGNTNFYRARTLLYSNDGFGNYTEIEDTPFINLERGETTFVDVDNDNDEDLFLSGYTNNLPSISISRLYLNDGNGNFTLATNSPLNADIVSGSLISAKFSDIDNDNDQDFLLAGYLNSGSTISNLYRNDGSGNFSLVPNNPFDELAFGDIVFEDIDNDQDEDIIFNGYDYNGSIAQTFNQYLNDGNGNFSLMLTNIAPFDNPRSSTLALADIDNDSDNDLIISGLDLLGTRLTQLYTNDGVGNFTLENNTPFEQVYNGTIAFSDLDNDNDQDVVISGTDLNEVRTTNVYSNDGSGNFTLEEDINFPGLSSSQIVFADINNNGKNDVLMSGWAGFKKVSKLYRNITGGLSNEDFNQSFRSVLYPNPTTGKVTLINQNFKSDIQIRVSTIEGKLIKELILTSEDYYSFDIMGSAGFYIVEIISSKNKETIKVIKRF